MLELSVRRKYPELKQLVAEASQALALLDADRLEDLALSCRALNRDLATAPPADRAQLARQSREAAGDMVVLARILDVTRDNIRVINRLRELRAGRREYTEQQAPGWMLPESKHGDN